VRERVRAIVDAPWFQACVITLILVNAVILGAETSPRVTDSYGRLLRAVDLTILALFVLELGMRMYAHRQAFFRDPWSWFDLVIVGVALLPSSGPFSVLRVLRVLRALRLLSVIPTLRHVVTGLFRALPGMMSILFLVVLLLYVSAVMATELFSDVSPQYFEDLPSSLFTLFQIATADGWGNIAKDVMEHKPMAWVFFVVFVLVSTLVALNLFIAVAVEALEKDDEESGGGRGGGSGSRAGGGPGEGGPDGGQAVILAELRALRAEVAVLRREREEEGSGLR
jgi:voltage-gated sodium channel